MSDELLKIAEKWWTPPAGIVGKLPRGGKEPFVRCSVCKGFHKTGAVHLDFVGHADLTRTLIEIDPWWDWEPLAFNEQGLPLIAHRGSQLVLWGKLTLLGKEMLCVGTCDDKADADKELVGDLLRNGAMRFGIFGALWSKTDGWQDDGTVAGEGVSGEHSQVGHEAGIAVPAAPSHPEPFDARGVVNKAFAAEPLPSVAISQPDKPLAAMTMRELLDFATENSVTVSGTKSDIVRTLEPLVRAASGAEPFDRAAGLEAYLAKKEAAEPEPEAIPFQPVLAKKQADAVKRAGAAVAVSSDREPA